MAQTMEIAPPEAVARSRDSSGMFPLELFKCLPIAQTVLPSTWRTIQDKTHLSLVLGVIAALLVVADSIYNFFNFRCPSGTFCIKEVSVLLFICPMILYFAQIIGQYDDRLQSKQQDVKEQKEAIQKAYNNMLADMDGLLTKSAESSSGLAERSFESKRRDFQRFLERAKSRYSQVFEGSEAENKKLVQEFRRFVVNWLKVFAECSIDPINCPKQPVTEFELERCISIAEICDLTLERLRVTEVRFISVQRDQDAQMIRKTKNEYRRMTTRASKIDQRQLALMESGERSLTTELAPGAGASRGCTWFTMGGSGVGFKSSTTEDGFPKELDLACCHVVILSKEHMTLLVGLLVGLALIGLEFMKLSDDDRDVSKPSVIELILVEACAIVLLIRFEEIDIIAQLEREVKDLKKAEQAVHDKRNKMQQFWNQAQQLTELWLYRTVPRLDLYKEIHSHLEDAPQGDLNAWLQKANTSLEHVDQHLGEIKDWKNDAGTLSIEAKKTFGKTINAVCHEQELVDIAKKLEDISANGLKCLGK